MLLMGVRRFKSFSARHKTLVLHVCVFKNQLPNRVSSINGEDTFMFFIFLIYTIKFNVNYNLASLKSLSYLGSAQFRQWISHQNNAIIKYLLEELRILMISLSSNKVTYTLQFQIKFCSCMTTLYINRGGFPFTLYSPLALWL